MAQLLICLIFAAPPNVIVGKCTSVHDGATITVVDGKNRQHNIRLVGIDAPELGQAYGVKAREHLSRMVHDKRVRVETHGKDKNLGTVFVDGVNANLQMVEDGFAWHYAHVEKSKELAAAQQSARAADRGLWKDKNPTPPWEFRRTQLDRQRRQNPAK